MLHFQEKMSKIMDFIFNKENSYESIIKKKINKTDEIILTIYKEIELTR